MPSLWLGLDSSKCPAPADDSILGIRILAGIMGRGASFANPDALKQCLAEFLVEVNGKVVYPKGRDPKSVDKVIICSPPYKAFLRKTKTLNENWTISESCIYQALGLALQLPATCIHYVLFQGIPWVCYGFCRNHAPYCIIISCSL